MSDTNTLKKIMIADDEEDIKIVLQMLLEAEGYEIITAYDGLDALDKAKTELPDMILLDIMMPMYDGIEVCKQLKADWKTKEIPIVMVSAAAQDSSVTRAMEAGANDYIIKPFDSEDVISKVKKYLNK